jgi:hypothetical protein
VESSERERLRRRTEVGLQKLRDADWDETSEVAARTAVRVVREMSEPNSDPPIIPWHRRRNVRIGGGIAATVLTLLASILAALERLGAFN